MKKTLLMSLFVITAIVLGSLLGNACIGAGALEWLSYSKEFSVQSGTVDIDIISVSFGFHFKVNVAQLILLFFGVFAYTKIAPKIITGK